MLRMSRGNEKGKVRRTQKDWRERIMYKVSPLILFLRAVVGAAYAEKPSEDTSPPQIEKSPAS